jgi:hypothetical protein
MTFEADQERMQQVMLPLDRPKPEALFKEGSQNFVLYTRLLQGPITNREIMRMCIPKYTGRISEIRAALRPHLMDVKSETDPGDRSRVTYKLAG